MLLEKWFFLYSRNLFRKEMVKNVTHITVNGQQKNGEEEEEERGKTQDYDI